jgi:hypothetical protein
MAMKETQKTFYALNLDPSSFKPNINDAINLVKLPIADADRDNSLKYIASTYDFENNVLREGTQYPGKRVITFSKILTHNIFPLAEIIHMALEMGQQEMSRPVEIEFAVDLNPFKGEPIVFNLLQIRPIVDNSELIEEKLDSIPYDKTILYAKSALGNGVIKNIQDILYVKPQSFNASKNPEIALKVSRMNDWFIAEKRNYILIGPGRWGSADPWLGIPVKWPQISAARLIVESGLSNYRIDPSQGTHFFQNLTSFRVGYFTINPYMKDGHWDLDYLSGREALYEDEYLRHVCFEHPLEILIDGRKNLGVVIKPE